MPFVKGNTIGAETRFKTGQSGNPLSPHFLDLAERWRNFDYLRIAGNRDDALDEAEGVLMLIPDDPR